MFIITTYLTTGNLFLELLSDKEKCTPGCIESCKVENMLYYNLEANETYWFTKKNLWNFVQTEGHRYQGRNVKNRGYVTYGIIVPKEDLIPIMEGQRIRKIG